MTLFIGDSRTELAKIPDASVQCCVTSPPYFGLRDYGHAEQIGLEKTPDEYVAQLVAVFREVRRVLRDDGTLWLNLGDSYAGSGKGGNPADSPHRKQASNHGSLMTTGDTARQAAVTNITRRTHEIGLKPKDIIGIPWRVAFALQADGWYLRQDIIWAKPNVMPESVRDRCTKSHEYVFMLTKSPRYFYDADAIREPCAEVSKKRAAYGWDCDRTSIKNGSAPKQDGHGRRHAGFNAPLPPRIESSGIHVEEMGSRTVNPSGRNKRDVWVIPPKPYSGAHFAVMPEALVEPCILAGSRPGDVVLDPFLGSGTVARVAQRLGREWIGIELNPAYASLIAERTEQTGMAL